jgi:hypothetical protein
MAVNLSARWAARGYSIEERTQHLIWLIAARDLEGYVVDGDEKFH